MNFTEIFSRLPWIEGYTAEMMRVHRQAVERQELEMHLAVRQTMKKYKRKRLNASVSPSRSLLKKLGSVGKSLLFIIEII